jgi:hypothetical protein
MAGVINSLTLIYKLNGKVGFSSFAVCQVTLHMASTCGRNRVICTHMRPGTRTHVAGLVLDLFFFLWPETARCVRCLYEPEPVPVHAVSRVPPSRQKAAKTRLKSAACSALRPARILAGTRKKRLSSGCAPC